MKRNCSGDSKQQGLTLIEVIFAMAILGTAIMSVFTIYSQCLVETRRAKNRTLATQYAQMMMEMIVSSPSPPSLYHGLATDAAPPSDNPVRKDLLTWTNHLHAFPTQATGKITVTDELHARRVTVDIRYNNYGRKTVCTLVRDFDRGGYD